jgi:hypothetical protein
MAAKMMLKCLGLANRYETKGEAEEVVRQRIGALRKHGDKRTVLRRYFCPGCNGHHITQNRRRSRQFA